jgi:hypothetical protein
MEALARELAAVPGRVSARSTERSYCDWETAGTQIASPVRASTTDA